MTGIDWAWQGMSAISAGILLLLITVFAIGSAFRRLWSRSRLRWLLVASFSLLSALALAGPVNVNTADAETISRELKGIGLAKARAIVQFREQHGEFELPEELLKVKGIGPRVLADNREHIRVSD